MTDMDAANLTVVQLANGRFAAVPEGAPMPEDGDFETLEEAEAWVYGQTTDMNAKADDLGILTPGGGQGVR